MIRGGRSIAVLAMAGMLTLGLPAGAQVSPEQPVASGVREIAVGDQSDPAIAWNQSGGLAAWEDDRWRDIEHFLPQGPQGSRDMHNIYATRLGEDGSPLGRVSFPITTQRGADHLPSIAASRNGFYVTWAHDRGAGEVLKGTFVSNDGRVSNRTHTFSTAGQYPPRGGVASDGDSFVVTWKDEDGEPTTESRLRSQLIGPAGDPVGSANTVPGPSDSELLRDPRISFGTTGYLVSYLHPFDQAKYVVLGLDGKPLGEPHLLPAGRDVAGPWQAYLDGSWLVAWTEEHLTDSGLDASRLLGVRVDDDGTMLHAEPVVISDSDERSVVALSAGQSCFVAALMTFDDETNTDVKAMRITSDLRLMDSEPLVVSQAPQRQEEISLGTRNDEIHLVYRSEERESAGIRQSGIVADVYRSKVGCSGAVEEPQPVSFSPVRQYEPHVIQGDGQKLVLWRERRDGGVADAELGLVLMGARFTDSGRPLDGTGFVIAAPSSPYYPGDPVAAWNGERYLVAWHEDHVDPYVGGPSTVRATAVTQDGRVLHPGGNPVAEMFGPPEGMSGAGDGFVLIWEDSENLETDLFGQRVTNDAQTDGRSFRLASSKRSDRFGDVARWGSDQILSYVSISELAGQDEKPVVRLQVFNSRGRVGRPIRVGAGGISGLDNAGARKVSIAWLAKNGKDLKQRYLMRGKRLSKTRTIRRAYGGLRRFSSTRPLPIRVVATRRASHLVWPSPSSRGDIDISTARLGKRIGRRKVVAGHASDELYFDVSQARGQRALLTYQRPGIERRYGGVWRVLYQMLRIE